MTLPEKQKIQELISLNPDARQYFFANADETWLDWLWANGFLDDIKKKADDPTRLSYRMPELDYLARIADRSPDKVANIILTVPISTETFNPEVIDRFVWILGNLPANQIARVIPKVRDERWVSLMIKFSRSGYEFDRILKKLVEAQDDESILALTQAILLVRPREEVLKEGSGYTSENPFYLDDIGQTDLFKAFVNIKEQYLEKALRLATDMMSQIVEVAGRETESEVFTVGDAFYLLDVDFFGLDVAQERHYSYRDDIRDLVATIRTLVQKTIGNPSITDIEATRIFDTYIATLPNSRSMWRLRLYALSLRPETFKEELRRAFFRLFEVDHYHEIDSGTEYKKALKKAFGSLSQEDQRMYVAKVFEYFKQKSEAHTDQNWHKHHGWEILSSVCAYLTYEEKANCKRYFDRECDGKYEPESEIGRMRSGFVDNQSPVNLSEYTVEQITQNLKTEWTADALQEKYKQDDFLSPRGVEGLGNELKDDLKKRTNEYTKNAIGFFDRASIHPHYTYSFLRSIEEMLREQNLPPESDWEGIFSLLDVIARSGIEVPFEKKKGDNWLTNWIGVHDAMADVLLQATASRKKDLPFDFNHYRDRIASILKYLFSVADPLPEDEKPDRGDLFHIAINSVRGRAFQVLVQFIFLDGKDFAKETKSKIKNDIKELYEEILSDKALSIRFVIGHYLGAFYFRDEEWVRNLLPTIFPVQKSKDHFLAAWEGYLANTLYKELYEELESLYCHAIDIPESEYTKRKYIKELDETLATHLALAFIHFTGFDDPLFKKFWDTPNIKRHEEFVSFLGRHYITRDQAGDEWFKEHEVNKQKLMDFWDWLLTRAGTPPEVFEGFGFWVNPHKEVLDLQWLASRMANTMEKAKGKIDWDYGLMEQLPKLAVVAPKETFKIIKTYLLDGDNINSHRSGWIHVDRELKEALSILYGNDSTKSEVYELVNKLITVGGQRFWILKEILI